MYNDFHHNDHNKCFLEKQDKVYNGPQDILLMKTNEQKIMVISTKDRLSSTYF